MKTLYLHIGTPKTATTAIQSFLWDNREVLEGKGYLYPMYEYQYENVQKYRNGHFLVGRIKDDQGKRLHEQMEACTRGGLEALQKDFERFDKIILSDEGVWNRGFFEDTHCWSKIKRELIEKGIRVKVIVYFRRQDEFLFSWWNQQVKEGMLGSSVLDWHEVVEQLPYIKLDYYGVLSQIAEYVGKDNITVRIFDKKEFSGGSIHGDFLEAVGLKYTEEYRVLAPMQNPSLTKNHIEIKRMMNTLPGLESRENNYFRKVLTEMSGKAEESRDITMFSEEERAEFMDTYREGNSRIAREYLGRDGELFTAGSQGSKKWTPENEEMLRDIVEFFGRTTLYLMKENENLKKELEVQKKHISNIRYKMRHPAKAAVEKIKRSGKTQ